MIDRNHVENHMPSSERLSKMINVNDLCDVWRHFHDGQKQYMGSGSSILRAQIRSTSAHGFHTVQMYF